MARRKYLAPVMLITITMFISHGHGAPISDLERRGMKRGYAESGQFCGDKRRGFSAQAKTDPFPFAAIRAAPSDSAGPKTGLGTSLKEGRKMGDTGLEPVTSRV